MFRYGVIRFWRQKGGGKGRERYETLGILQMVADGFWGIFQTPWTSSPKNNMSFF